MLFKFKLKNYDRQEVEINQSLWSGEFKVYINGRELKRLDGKGKPFEINTTDNETKKMFLKSNLIDSAFKVILDDVEIFVAPKLKSYEYLIGGLPFILIFIGGAIGGIIGFLGANINYRVFRSEFSKMTKYISILGITFASTLLYLICSILINLLIS